MTYYGWYSIIKYKEGSTEYLGYTLYDQPTLCNLITDTIIGISDDYFFCGELISYMYY
jgi:hypothetical protein